MNQTPELHDEIVRKAFETIEKMETDKSSGKITAVQYSYGVDILWSALAGLVDDDFMRALEMMGENRRAPETKLFFFDEKTGIVIRIVNDHAGKLTYTTFAPGKNAENKVFDYKQEIKPMEHVKKTLKAIVTMLSKKGFSLL